MSDEYVNVGAIQRVPALFQNLSTLVARKKSPLVEAAPPGTSAGREATVQDTVIAITGKLEDTDDEAIIEVIARKPFRLEWIDALDQPSAGATPGVCFFRLFAGLSLVGNDLAPLPFASFAPGNTRNNISARSVQAGEVLRLEVNRTAAPGAGEQVNFVVTLKGSTLE